MNTQCETAILWESRWKRNEDGSWTQVPDTIRFVDESKSVQFDPPARRGGEFGRPVGKARTHLEELGYNKEYECHRAEFTMSLWTREPK